jgi:recombinational DNA repair ATPase RecF
MYTKKLVISPSKSDPALSEGTSAGPIVVVGANSSGKTQLGWWIEKRDTANVHRVSAQKSLALPKEVHTRSLEKVAERW